MSFINGSDYGTVKLHLWNYVFLYACIILFSSQCVSLKSDKFVCRLTDTCQCMFDNQEGIDLSVLSENRYGLNTTRNNVTFFFHPCTEISVGNTSNSNACSSVSVCLFNQTDQMYTNLGSITDLTFVSHGIKNPVILQYKHNNSITNILLNCVSSGDILESLPSEVANVYELRLSSPAACRRAVSLRASSSSSSFAASAASPAPPAPAPAEGESPHLSTGSLLVILLVVGVGVYLVGGALALKLLRGAEGREMIPHYDFWARLPGLVKEGMLFVVGGCRPVQAYDRI